MIFVERLQEYSPQDAAEIGLLRPLLSQNRSNTPVPEVHLRHIIESPDHEQFVARLESDRSIVGTATVSIVSGALTKDKAWLEDLVANTEVARGIGQQLWNEIGLWCQERDIDLAFTSKPQRTAAHNFYLKNGAKIRTTTAFKKTFRKS